MVSGAHAHPDTDVSELEARVAALESHTHGLPILDGDTPPPVEPPVEPPEPPAEGTLITPDMDVQAEIDRLGDEAVLVFAGDFQGLSLVMREGQQWHAHEDNGARFDGTGQQALIDFTTIGSGYIGALDVFNYTPATQRAALQLKSSTGITLDHTHVHDIKNGRGISVPRVGGRVYDVVTERCAEVGIGGGGAGSSGKPLQDLRVERWRDVGSGKGAAGGIAGSGKFADIGDGRTLNELMPTVLGGDLEIGFDQWLDELPEQLRQPEHAVFIDCQLEGQLWFDVRCWGYHVRGGDYGRIHVELSGPGTISVPRTPGRQKDNGALHDVMGAQILINAAWGVLVEEPIVGVPVDGDGIGLRTQSARAMDGCFLPAVGNTIKGHRVSYAPGTSGSTGIFDSTGLGDVAGTVTIDEFLWKLSARPEGRNTFTEGHYVIPDGLPSANQFFGYFEQGDNRRTGRINLAKHQANGFDVDAEIEEI